MSQGNANLGHNKQEVESNLVNTISKAIKMQHKKIYLRQDNFFRIEGHIKRLFNAPDKTCEVANLRLYLTDTRVH